MDKNIKKYKTELHLHCTGVSRCATVTPEQIVEEYVRAGYTTVVLTNHLIEGYITRGDMYKDWRDMTEQYVEAYKKLKRDAEGKLNVIFGAEISFAENYNDYLIYGITEDFLLKADDLCLLGIEGFYKVAKENGFLIYQAHPMRKGMVIPDVRFLYGIEVFNGAHGHNSRNPIANAWADYNGLKKISGTDYHHITSPINAGITTDKEIKTLEDLLVVLKSGEYGLIRKPWKNFLGNKPNIHAKEID